MTLNDLEWLFDVKIRFRPALCCRIDASFGAHCTNLNEDRPILSAAKMYVNDCTFWKYKVHAELRIFAGVRLGRGAYFVFIHRDGNMRRPRGRRIGLGLGLGIGIGLGLVTAH